MPWSKDLVWYLNQERVVLLSGASCPSAYLPDSGRNFQQSTGDQTNNGSFHCIPSSFSLAKVSENNVREIDRE